MVSDGRGRVSDPVQIVFGSEQGLIPQEGLRVLEDGMGGTDGPRAQSNSLHMCDNYMYAYTIMTMFKPKTEAQ